MNVFKSVTLWLYILIAVFTSLSTISGSDEAKEMVNKAALFYAKGFVAVVMAALLAAKMYLSVPKPDETKEPPKDK